MKKKLVLLAAGLGLMVSMNAQNWSGITPGNIFYNQGCVIIGSTETRGGDKFHVNTGGQFFRVMQDGFGVADAGWRNTLVLSNYYDYAEIYNNDGKPVVFQNKYRGNVGIGITNPSSQLHIASDADHAFTISRNDGTYGFRIFRNAQSGNFYFQIGTGPNTWETKIKIGEGEGANTKLLLNPDGGNVLIGKTSQNPGVNYKLDVDGSIRANEIKVNTTGADFVFEPTYKLRPLSEVETFIKTNKHLPEIAPAADMEANGLNISEMQTKLLQKVEELTLYSIELKKETLAQNKKNVELQAKYEALLKKVENLSKLIETR